MRPARSILYSLLLACLVLSGCRATSESTPLARPAPTPSATSSLTRQTATASLPTTMDCLLVSSQPTSAATEPSIFPPPGPDDHILGPADAEATFLEYTDYQAPASAALDGVLANLSAKYPASVRRVLRPFPLPTNDKASLAAAAAEAAALQGKFWELSALFIARQDEWSALDVPAFQKWILARAPDLDLDPVRLKTDFSSQAVLTRVNTAQHFGLTSAIPTMPFLLINGRIYQGPRDQRSLENLLNLLRMEKHQFTDCPAFIIDPQKSYIAELTTSKGKITIQLLPQEAPLAVNNFVFLARQGWYNGMTFHRVIQGQLAQSGDPSGTGFGSPGYAFPDEISSLTFDKPGVLAMANAGPDSNGSQFFITYRAMPEIDGKATIFGSVLEGLDVLNALTARDPSQPSAQPDGDVINKVIIREA